MLSLATDVKSVKFFIHMILIYMSYLSMCCIKVVPSNKDTGSYSYYT